MRMKTVPAWGLTAADHGSFVRVEHTDVSGVLRGARTFYQAVPTPDLSGGMGSFMPGELRVALYIAGSEIPTYIGPDTQVIVSTAPDEDRRGRGIRVNPERCPGCDTAEPARSDLRGALDTMSPPDQALPLAVLAAGNTIAAAIRDHRGAP